VTSRTSLSSAANPAAVLKATNALSNVVKLSVAQRVKPVAPLSAAAKARSAQNPAARLPAVARK